MQVKLSSITGVPIRYQKITRVVQYPGTHGRPNDY